ncbi:MAG: organomercurial lyase [Anaerolineales bacterium]|jgi:alkylmercury lyase
MTELNLDEYLKDWDFKNSGTSPEESTLAARLEILMYRTLAEGQPVSADLLASAAKVPVEIVNTIFQQGKALGGEWDDEGRLLGNVLTLIPTRHHFQVNGNQLYTWCSMDAMHLPHLLGVTAEVESTDPISGEVIKLTIPPDGLPTYHPPETVLSIVLTGGDRSGPQSPLCSQMHFFASRETAQQWVKDHPDATIMTVEEVAQLVREHIHAPLEKVLHELE